MGAAKRSETSWRAEADALVHDLSGRVWYEYRQVKAGQSMLFEYLIYRRGMGCIGRRRTAQQLVQILRAQLPHEDTKNHNFRFS